MNSSQYEKLLEFSPNLILYGPPGTGKTFKAKEIAEDITTNQNYKQGYTWKILASLVLLENNGLPLHYNEISKRILEKNLKNTSGKTPEQTILRDIGKDIEDGKEISFFMKSEDGIYGLNLPFTFKKAAEFVLYANNEPMKINDIAKQIVKYNFVDSDGQTPDRTLSTEILRDKDDGDESVFIQLDNGLITLRGISSNFIQSGDENNNFIRKVTFHPSYSYEDFVEGFRPNVDGGSDPYVLNAGIFKEICYEAKNDLENKYVLLIDEINRGNIPKIFGELITLIEKDKRNPENSLKLTYSKDDFFVPENLIIIGTMNTADKSLVQMDEALRRRFVFEELMPEPELLETLNSPGKKYKDILVNINKKIIEGDNIKQFRDRQIGHSYFMEEPFGDKELRLVIKYQILPLLQDYFYDDYDEIKRILGSKIIGPDNRPGKILDEGNESELIGELRSHLNNTQKTTDTAKNPDEELN